MPIYEYCCENCGHELETIQKMVDEPLKDCPECEKSTLRKKISAVAFRLKGSGWYETDFKTGDKKNLLDSGSNAKAEDKSAGEQSKSENKSTDSKSTGDTKPATKTQAKSKSTSTDAGKSSKAAS